MTSCLVFLLWYFFYLSLFLRKSFEEVKLSWKVHFNSKNGVLCCSNCFFVMIVGFGPWDPFLWSQGTSHTSESWQTCWSNLLLGRSFTGTKTKCCWGMIFCLTSFWNFCDYISWYFLFCFQFLSSTLVQYWPNKADRKSQWSLIRGQLLQV